MGVISEIQQEMLFDPTGELLAIDYQLIDWSVDNIKYYAEEMSRKLYDLQYYQYVDPVWWQEIAAMGEMVSLVNAAIMMIYFDMGVIESNIDYTLDPFWTFALETLGFRYNETAERFDMITSGLFGELYTDVTVLKTEVHTIIDTQIPKLETRMDDLENSVGELTPEVLEKIEIVAENIDDILEFMENGIEYLLGEVQEGVVNMVKAYVDPQIDLITTELGNLWVEVSRYGNVFIDVILSLINILLTGVEIPADQIENILANINKWIIEEVTKQTASLQAEVNVLYNEVYLMSDVWITALKKKLVI